LALGDASHNKPDRRPPVSLIASATPVRRLRWRLQGKHKSNIYGRKLAEGAFIHSDQGVHYTSPHFQKLVKKMGLGQSMSRRGNCWDNAPQESFFGHFKDEIDMKSCETLEDVKREIKSYMTYYNHYRGQWNLKRMTLAEYRRHLLQVS